MKQRIGFAHFHHNGGLRREFTVAYWDNNDGTVNYGVGLVHEKDRFEKKVGREVAELHLKQSPLTVTVPRNEVGRSTRDSILSAILESSPVKQYRRGDVAQWSRELGAPLNHVFGVAYGDPRPTLTIL